MDSFCILRAILSIHPLTGSIKDRAVGLQHRLLSKEGKCMKNCIVHCKTEERIPLIAIFIGERNLGTQ